MGPVCSREEGHSTGIRPPGASLGSAVFVCGCGYYNLSEPPLSHLSGLLTPGLSLGREED